MLIAALVAVTSFAQPVKKQQQLTVKQQLTEVQRTPSMNHRFQSIQQVPAIKSNALKMKKAAKAPKKAPTLGEPFTAIACSYVFTMDNNGNVAPYEDIPYSGVATTITVSTDLTTVTIEGLITDADQPITANLNIADLTFTIPAGQLLIESVQLSESETAPVYLVNAEDSSAPLTGTLSLDGTVSINELWYGEVGGDGQYSGYPYTDFYYTPLIALPNATMSSSVSVDTPLYVSFEGHYATVFNFGGDFGYGIDITLLPDNAFEIPQQGAVYAGGSHGVLSLMATDGANVWSPITGTGDNKVLTFTDDWTEFSSKSNAWTGVHSGTTITLLNDEDEWPFPVIQDVAAMPADPEFIAINSYDANYGYGSVVVYIPTDDVEGNMMDVNQLYYIIYGKNGDEITPITYPADLYDYLDEDLTEIPYTFNDDWDFQERNGNKMVFLNFEFDYETMGVQVVYKAGGEVNATEIIWYEVEESETTVAQWVAAEQGYENTQEVTDIVISEEDGITGVFAQNDGGNSPKYYDRGESVRMYPLNTLTISSEEYPIAKIELLLGTRTDIALASEEGDFEVDTENSIATWEGEAYDVVFTVPDGLQPAGQTYIAGINVYYVAEEKEPELIELPEGAEIEEYFYHATIDKEEVDDEGNIMGYSEEAVNTSVNVAFVDDQVYIQGLSRRNPESWVVGTLTDNVLTIPAGEYVGDYLYFADSGDIYFLNLMTDEMTFTYDPENDKFTTTSIAFDAFYEGSLLGTLEYYDYSEITKIVEMAATPADPEFVSLNLDVNETSYPYVTYDIPLYDTNNNPMLSSKLYYRFYYATEEEGEVLYVCTTDAYEEISEDMSEIPYNFSDGWDIYNYQLYVYGEDFTKWTKIGIQSVYYGGGEMNESNIVWLDLTDYWEAVGIEEIAAAQSKSVKFYDLQGRQVNADAKGIVIRVDRMADGSTKTTKMLRK